MLPYKTGFRYPIGFRGSAGFGFGDGFSPESVFGWVRVLSWIFGFGWPDTPPDPNPPHCRPYVTRWPITKTLSLMSQKVKCGMQMLHNMQVSHNEVHEWVSSILKDSGFCPGEIIDAGKLYYFYSPLLCFNDYNFTYNCTINMLVHFFILLVLEAAPIRMYCLKRGHLTTMGTWLQSKQVVSIQ